MSKKGKEEKIMKNECKHERLVIEVTKSRKGLYCLECGKWLKWLGKQEYNKLRFQGNVKIIYALN